MSGRQGLGSIRNGVPVPRHQIPELAIADFRQDVINAVNSGQRVAAFFGDSSGSADPPDVYAILADARRGTLHFAKTKLASERFPSLTPECPQLQLFEREIAEQYGVIPESHPWFKPVRFHASYRPGRDAWGRTS